MKMGAQPAMGRPSRAVIVTTINSPNACLRALDAGAGRHEFPFIVAGDTKSPGDFSLPNCDYYPIERQIEAFPDLCAVLPTRHYARKNAAYLVAMELGVSEIQETDDDNLPLDGFWRPFPTSLTVEAVRSEGGAWFNVYKLFSDATIWPRGLPLEFVHSSAGHVSLGPRVTRGLIVQGLADDNPDVDAVYRLTRELPVRFRHRPPVLLPEGTWCPFNSQNTLFRREVFPLLYLPSMCSFRMTDIWRSFVAQRCLWELGEGVVFHAPTVSQERNEHNLLQDFEHEIPGYRFNERIRQTLESCRLDSTDVLGNLVRCYEALITGEFVGHDEMPILRQWCSAAAKMM
jgi:hypothetical protein